MPVFRIWEDFQCGGSLGDGIVAAPISTSDSVTDRVSKLLPADITAAFLSAKASLLAGMGEPNADAAIFWTFITILLIAPLYFWFVSKVRNPPQLIFLALSFIVFAVSIADKQFTAFLGKSITYDLEAPIRIAAIVLPFLWAFIISQIFVAALGGKIEGDTK